MQNIVDLEHCLTFVNSQLRPAGWKLPGGSKSAPLRAVTISRQAGCGAGIVAGKLTKLLQYDDAADSRSWTILDRNLMAKVLEEHHMPARLAQFLPEDRITELQDIIDNLCGLHPPTWGIIEQTTETILHLVEAGNVIIIGRGANVVTAKLSDVFHVRLVAPLEKRIQHAHEFYELTEREARTFCLHEDLGRARYLKKYFKADINDPLLYHLVINTGLVSYDEAAQIIANAALKKVEETSIIVR